MSHLAANLLVAAMKDVNHPPPKNFKEVKVSY